MSKKKLKTITICWRDNPVASLCPGHVDAKTFNKAYAAEGWKGNDPIEADELIFAWYREDSRGYYHACSHSAKGAKPYTVAGW